MDILLSKVTQQAMNHAIRCGITITSGYAIRQCSRLLRTAKENQAEMTEIATLQRRLEAKIRIISPAIDMIELIAARGNTSLESAVTLTKQIRWEIQSLGVRLARAATEEEAHRRGSSRAKTKAQSQHELKLIIADMKRLLERIEDAVPLINLAITTSGVNLSTTLPSTVSPSRLLQASTFLTAGDTRYAMSPRQPIQIGPVFTLSMYMLFSAHAFRPHEEGAVRETTWKEVMHKARLKLLRVPLDRIYDLPNSESGQLAVFTGDTQTGDQDDDLKDVPSEGRAFEFTYQLLIIEDLDDDRVHTFEEGDIKPGPLDDVAVAGLREALPIHEISKIFYADTGKILNIGTDGEVNNPVLLLKRDTNAVPPRRMMSEDTVEAPWYESEEYLDGGEDSSDGLAHVSAQYGKGPEQPEKATAAGANPEGTTSTPWSLPRNLDPEWIAFEVYNETVDSDDDDDLDEDSFSRNSSAPIHPRRSPAVNTPDPMMTAAFSNLHLRGTTPVSPPRLHHSAQLAKQNSSTEMANIHPLPTAPTTLPALRTSLSLLELLIRLTVLQQFQQMSHLAINDELLNFFLNEAGTTGAGGDAETRQRVRREARERVGFDPYDESPIKRRGEDYLEHYADGSRYGGTEADNEDGATPQSARYSPRPANGYRASFNGTSARVPLRTAQHDAPFPGANSPITSSPLARKSRIVRELSHRVATEKGFQSPLVKSESDSTLGTSPGSGDRQKE